MAFIHFMKQTNTTAATVFTTTNHLRVCPYVHTAAHTRQLRHQVKEGMKVPDTLSEEHIPPSLRAGTNIVSLINVE